MGRRFIRSLAAPSQLLDKFELRTLLIYADNLRRSMVTLGVMPAELKEALTLVVGRVAVHLEDSGWPDDPDELSLSDLTQRLQAAVKTVHAEKIPAPSELQQHLNAIAHFFALDENDTALFGLLVRIQLSAEVGRLWTASNFHRDPSTDARSLAWLASVAGVPRATAESLRVGGTLVSAGLCTLDVMGDIGIPNVLYRLMRNYAKPPADLSEHLIGPAQTARLQWDDFQHLGKCRDLLQRILARPASSGECGLHILLYGPPGTGKTEFARTLAGRVGLPLAALGEADESGHEPNRADRLADLRRMSYMFQRRPRPMLLMVDEAEDVLGYVETVELSGRRSSRSQGSKVYLHRLLEHYSVPVIWIVNEIEAVPDTVIRRMMYALEFKQPGARTREAIWTKALAGWDLSPTPEDVSSLARDVVVPPAIAHSAARAATLIEGGIAEVRAVSLSLAKALNGGLDCTIESQRCERYLPQLVNADARSLQTMDRVAQAGGGLPETPFSLCLYGPPGTGKSAYARHLAAQLGLGVLHKRVSDLVSKWVGDTEKKIAAAFREARSERAMLIFDEADSLLRSRELAHTGWEVSQVNEMLTWMESHPLPFVCTTNLLDTLDAASLRRFTFKLRFDYLTRDQTCTAYEHFFGRPAPLALEQIGLLTPSDFALALKRAQLCGIENDDEAVIALLLGETRLKPDFRRGIGFGAT